MAIDESLYLTVTVRGDTSSIPEPILPRMDNFNVYSSGRSQNFSFVNGSVNSSVAFTYILTPRFLGKQKIPPISILAGAEKYLTPEMEITVTTPSAQPQASQPDAQPRRRPASGAGGQTTGERNEPLFMTAETDKKAAYPGEQVNLTIRFFTSVPLSSNPQYVPPQLKNLLSEDLPPVRNGETTVRGARYSFSEIKTALFGVGEGAASVGPASVLAQVHGAGALDPFDPNFFQQFFAGGGQGEPKQVTSNAVNLKILPFPAGAPPSFSGAVGSFALSAGLDHKEIKAGEALSLSVSITGKGTVKTLTAPKLPEMPDFKVYDTMSSLNISKTGDVIGGKKTFTTILIPKTEGRRTVPQIRFSYLDPDTKSYRELSAGPFEVNVTKGDGEARNFSFAHGGRPDGITTLASDIRYVSDKASPPGAAALAARVSALPDWLNGFPAALVLLALWLARLKELRIRNPLLFRFRKAGGAARADLAAASAKLAAGKPEEAAAALYDSLLDYLHDKSGLKASGLTIKRALAMLKEKFPAAGERSLAEIKDLWEKLEALHFSPGGAGAGEIRDMMEKYSALLDLLEREFKK